MITDEKFNQYILWIIKEIYVELSAKEMPPEGATSLQPLEAKFILRDLSSADAAIPSKHIQKQLLERLREFGALDFSPLSPHQFIQRIDDRFLVTICPRELEEVRLAAEQGSLKWDIAHEQISKSSIHKINPKLPQGTKWQDITMRFIDGHTVKIRIKGLNKTITSDYVQMGFEHKRAKKPNKIWDLLVDLAQTTGTKDWGQLSSKKSYDLPEDGMSLGKFPDKTKKNKQLLSEALRNYFGIKEDPFLLYRKEKAYKLKITLRN